MRVGNICVLVIVESLFLRRMLNLDRVVTQKLRESRG